MTFVYHILVFEFWVFGCLVTVKWHCHKIMSNYNLKVNLSPSFFLFSFLFLNWHTDDLVAYSSMLSLLLRNHSNWVIVKCVDIFRMYSCRETFNAMHHTNTQITFKWNLVDDLPLNKMKRIQGSTWLIDCRLKRRKKTKTKFICIRAQYWRKICLFCPTNLSILWQKMDWEHNLFSKLWKLFPIY